MNGGQILPSQNLIREVREEPAAAKPGFYKSLIFDVLAVLWATALGYFYKGYLDGNFGLNIVIVWAALFLTFSAVYALTPASGKRRFFIVCLQAAGLTAFFYGYDWRVLLLIWLAGAIVIFWGHSNCRSELENYLQIRFFRATKYILVRTTTALVFLAVALYLPRWDARSVFISPGSFDAFYGWTTSLVAKSYPEIDFSGNFQSFAKSVARLQLQNNDVFRRMSGAAEEQLINQASSQVISDLSKSLGINIGPGEKTSGVFYDFIVGKLREWQAAYETAFLVVWAVLVFMILRGLGTIVYWLASIVAFVVYEVFISLGVVHIMGESRTHEIIEY